MRSTEDMMGNRLVAKRDIFSPGIPDALVAVDELHATLERVAQEAAGCAWFAVGVIANHAIVLPRLVVGIDSTDEIPAAAAAALCPLPVELPSALWRGRAADIGRPVRDGRTSMMLPLEAVIRHANGVRDRGRQHDVQRDLALWVHETVRYDVALDRPTSIGHLARRDVPREMSPSDEKRIKRGVRETRRRLADAGVLPWVCFRNGVVPRSRWWDRPEFAAALSEWNRQGPLVRAHWARLGVSGEIAEAETRTRAGITAARAAITRTGDVDTARAAGVAAYWQAA